MYYALFGGFFIGFLCFGFLCLFIVFRGIRWFSLIIVWISRSAFDRLGFVINHPCWIEVHLGMICCCCVICENVAHLFLIRLSLNEEEFHRDLKMVFKQTFCWCLKGYRHRSWWNRPWEYWLEWQRSRMRKILQDEWQIWRCRHKEWSWPYPPVTLKDIL